MKNPFPNYKEYEEFMEQVECWHAQNHIDNCPKCRAILRDLLLEEDMAQKTEEALLKN